MSFLAQKADYSPPEKVKQITVTMSSKCYGRMQIMRRRKKKSNEGKPVATLEAGEAEVTLGVGLGTVKKTQA